MPKRKTEEFDPILALPASEESLANAKSLIEESEFLSGRGKHGFAASLLVVALEEIGKAMTLRFIHDTIGKEIESQVVGPGVEISHRVTTPVFHDHAMKKFMAFIMIPSLGLIQKRVEKGSKMAEPSIDQMMALMGNFKSFLEKRGKDEEPSVSATEEDNGDRLFNQVFLQMMISAGKAAKDYEIIRLKGLYVDILQGKLQKPSNIGVEKYVTLHEYAIAALPIAQNTVSSGYPESVLATMHEWIQKEKTEDRGVKIG